MTTTLWIAEKPAVALLLANALGGGKKNEGYFDCGQNKVTWCYGHLIESQPPENYNPDYKKWSIESLPLQLYPPVYKEKDSCKKQVAIIKSLLINTDTVVNAADIDDEGQCLVDELLIYLDWKGYTQRVLINDMNDEAVKKAVQNLKPNSNFKGQYLRAYARSCADEIFGLNLTRALTVHAQNNGFKGKALSVGRVITPTLALVVNRYNEVKNHTASYYYQLSANIKSDKGSFKALLVPNKKYYLDENNRIINSSILVDMSATLKNKKGTVVDHSIKETKQSPPMPFNLAKLQQFLNKNFKFTAHKTLEITQKLREEYKAISYNRSDCSYLSSEQYSESSNILDKLLLIKEYNGTKINKSIKSKAFNDSKITAHTAIIPTGKLTDMSILGNDEKIVYKAICDQYLAQFMQDKIIEKVTGNIEVVDHVFKFSSSKVLQNGWSSFLKDNSESEDTLNNEPGLSNFEIEKNLKNGDIVFFDLLKVETLKTAPKKLFTEATLLSAMTRIADFIQDEKIKKLLKEKDKDSKDENGSIGTPATRSSIIENLKKTNYVIVEKNNLIPTQNAIDLISMLPSSITNPDMTALWFEMQNDIAENKMSVDEFIKGIYEKVEIYIKMVLDLKLSLTSDVSKENQFICPKCKKSKMRNGEKLLKCVDSGCAFIVWKTICEKKLTENQLKNLIEKRKTPLIKGFISKNSKIFNAKLILNDDFKIAFEFEKTK